MTKVLREGRAAKVMAEHFPNYLVNLENLDYGNIENVAKRLPKTISAETLRQVCIHQQEAVIKSLSHGNLYSEMAKLSPSLDFSYVPIRQLEERMREHKQNEAKRQHQMDIEHHHDQSSDDHLSMGKVQQISADDTGFDCQLRNIMDEDQQYRNRGAWMHQTHLFDLI